MDSYDTLVSRWIDNRVMLLVSTAHYPREFFERFRRRPLLTGINYSHIAQVWGQSPHRLIQIPSIVFDYNANMGGVVLSQQQSIYFMNQR